MSPAAAQAELARRTQAPTAAPAPGGRRRAHGLADLRGDLGGERRERELLARLRDLLQPAAAAARRLAADRARARPRGPRTEPRTPTRAQPQPWRCARSPPRTAGPAAMSPLEEAAARALAGGPERHRAKALEQGKLPVRERVALLLDEGTFAEEALLANWDQDGLGADGVVTGVGEIDGAARGADGQRPHGQGRLVGAEDGREDPPHPGTGALARGSDGLPRRLGRGADHRAGADVPRPPRRRADLPQPGEALRRRPAGLRAVRSERRRRRLHPGVLRHRDHARRQRLDVPRLAAHGRDGDRREGDARGDGRGADAHRGSPAAVISW